MQQEGLQAGGMCQRNLVKPHLVRSVDLDRQLGPNCWK